MRQVVSLAVKALITLALLYFALRGTDFKSLAQRLQGVHVAWMMAAVAVLMLQIAVVGVRWGEIATRCGTTLPVTQGIRYTLIAAFFNQVLPSTVGGDAVRIWMFARAGAGWSKSTYSVLLDRFFGVLGLALMVVLCLPWSLVLIKNPVGQAALLAIGACSIGGAVVFIALGYLRWHRLMEWAPTRHLIQMSVTTREIMFSLRAMTIVIVLSLVVHALSVVVAWCAAQSVDAPFQFGHALLLLPPVLLIASVPISIAGWGVRESVFVLAFSYAGLPEADGLIVSVLFGAGFFIVGLAGGLTWLLSSEQIGLGAFKSEQPPQS
jgi:uncharacterized membrane protein YbhN (UPF0104 family)